MNKTEDELDFERANQKIHLVEDQWHFPVMTKHGFVASNKEAPGFVRDYVYTKGEERIRLSTGVSSDYWTDLRTKKSGYWSDLEKYLKTLTAKV